MNWLSMYTEHHHFHPHTLCSYEALEDSSVARGGVEASVTVCTHKTYVEWGQYKGSRDSRGRPVVLGTTCGYCCHHQFTDEEVEAQA